MKKTSDYIKDSRIVYVYVIVYVTKLLYLTKLSFLDLCCKGEFQQYDKFVINDPYQT